MLLAQCVREQLVKWSFWPQKLRGSVKNAGRLIRAPAPESEAHLDNKLNGFVSGGFFFKNDENEKEFKTYCFVQNSL